jgi:hypothetical protein
VPNRRARKPVDREAVLERKLVQADQLQCARLCADSESGRSLAEARVAKLEREVAIDLIAAEDLPSHLVVEVVVAAERSTGVPADLALLLG